MRITTKSIMRGYNYDLTKALNNWNKAQQTVLTQRNFNSIAEDPSGATRSFKLRQQFRTNNMQLEMANQAESLLDQAVSSAMQISDILCNTVNKDIISATNATNLAPDVRASYAAALRGMRDSIVLASNSQVSGRYIFGGASTKEVPFEMDADGNLTYRGVNVDAGDMDLYTNENGDPYFLDAEGKIIENASCTKETVFIKDGTALVQGPAGDYTDIVDGKPVIHHDEYTVPHDPNKTKTKYLFYKADGSGNLIEGKDYDSVVGGVPYLNNHALTNTDYDSSKTTVLSTTYYDANGKELVQGKDFDRIADNGKLIKNAYDEPVAYDTEEIRYTVKDKDNNPVTGDFKTVKNADGEVTEQKNMLKARTVLDNLANESLYLDLGFGLESDADGNTVSTSAFNTAIPGITMLGYGKDENGLSNNVVVLLGQLADELEKEPFSETNYGKLMDKFGECIDQITDFEASLGTKQNFVDGTVTRLEQYNDSLNDRIVDVERVDMAEAISTYTWMGYAYNAALKVGTDIVSNSLLDYMK